MKFPVDENLSPALCERLADNFPGSQHVPALGLGAQGDSAVREHARLGGFVMLTKDSDYLERGILFGYPPKVIWLRVGNCTTAEVEQILRRNLELITRFGRDRNAVLILR